MLTPTTVPNTTSHYFSFLSFVYFYFPTLFSSFPFSLFFFFFFFLEEFYLLFMSVHNNNKKKQLLNLFICYLIATKDKVYFHISGIFSSKGSFVGVVPHQPANMSFRQLIWLWCAEEQK